MKIVIAVFVILATFAFKPIQITAQQVSDHFDRRTGNRIERIPIVKEPNPCKTLNLNGNQNQLEILEAANNALRPPQLKKSDRNTPPPNEFQKVEKHDQYVSVFVLPTLGPIGKAFVRNDFGQLVKLPDEKDSKSKLPFVYPSLYFDISASPRLTGVTGDNENIFAIREVRNQKIEMMWMDVTFELFPYCKDKEGKPTECKCVETDKVKYCNEPQLRVLSVLPNETISGARDSIPVQLAGAASELATLSLPFYASSSFGTRSEAGTKGVTVLFNNLFPPKPFTYQHAYINSGSGFGWNFHNQSRLKDSKAVSIMGLHKTAAVLQVREDVQLIGVRYYSMSEWNKRPNAHSDKYDLRSDGLCIEIPKPEEEKTNYKKLANLDNFPFLIPKEDVCKILQVEEKNACEKIFKEINDPASATGIKTSFNPDFVIKSSLEKYLGLEKSKKEEKPSEENKNTASSVKP